MSLRIPLLPRIFYFLFYWEMTIPIPSRISTSATKTANLFGKVHFHDKYNHQSKEQGRLAYIKCMMQQFSFIK